MKDIDEFLEKYLDMLPTTGTLSPGDAESRASQFLTGLAHLTNYKHQLNDDLIKNTSLRDVAYATALSMSQGSNAETRKANAEANGDYIQTREAFEDIQNKIYTIKTYQEIFFEAARFYRKSAIEMGRGF